MMQETSAYQQEMIKNLRTQLSEARESLEKQNKALNLNHAGSSQD